MPITKEIIKQVEKLAWDEVRPIMGYGYPFFEWYLDIKINETVENYEEENLGVGEEIPIQHEYNLVDMEIE